MRSQEGTCGFWRNIRHRLSVFSLLCMCVCCMMLECMPLHLLHVVSVLCVYYTCLLVLCMMWISPFAILAWHALYCSIFSQCFSVIHANTELSAACRMCKCIFVNYACCAHPVIDCLHIRTHGLWCYLACITSLTGALCCRCVTTTSNLLLRRHPILLPESSYQVRSQIQCA